MMKIKFIRDAIYETEGPGKGHTFKAGEVHEFEPAFAQRWIRRGMAEEVDATPQFKPVTRVKVPDQPAPEDSAAKKAADEDTARTREAKAKSDADEAKAKADEEAKRKAEAEKAKGGKK